MFNFEITARLKKTRARTGIFHTPHHDLETPEFAIVATDGQLKSIANEFWPKIPSQYVIVNTFHISNKHAKDKEENVTILDRVHEKGGIHSYMNLKNRTIASDSGGFQVFSLGFGKVHNIGKIGGFFPQKDAFLTESDSGNPLTIADEGVSFRFDEKTIHLNPEISMDIQHKIGADIMFAFDECTSPLNTKEYTRKSLLRTNAWVDRCIRAHKGFENKQALFGIVQGGPYEDLRIEAAKVIGSKDVPGFGIGGSMGRVREDLPIILSWIMPHLPEEKPRHLLGIGSIRHIFDSVEQGIDLFDCVIPTREARHKMLYTKKGRLYLRKLRTVDEVIDSACGCFACKEKITYKKLWELFIKKDPKSVFYASAHNIWFFTDLMRQIRDSIKEKSFFKLKEEYSRCY